MPSVGGFAVSAAATDNANHKRNEYGLSPLSVALLPLLVLFVATMVLFWLSQKDIGATFKYWEIFVPVVAVVSLLSGWTQAYVGSHNRMWYVLRQVIHWGLLIGFLYLLNIQGYRELMSDQQYTALIIYLLALGTVLAAIQMDIKLVFFAVFLVFCGYLIAVPADNPTLIGVGSFMGISEPQTKPILVSGLLAVAGFVASVFIVLVMRGGVIAKKARKNRKK
jgi:hypothetical protein